MPLCTTAQAQTPHLTYLGYRWMTNDNVTINLGYEEVGNLDGPQVASAMQAAINTWRNPTGGAALTVHYTGQHYSLQRNSSNEVWWEYIWGDTLASTVEYTTSDYWSRRIREVDQRYSSGPGSNSYCWWDCTQGHAQLCQPSQDYDFQSVALHEWGHGFAGLFHTVDPNCDYAVSVMQSRAKSSCSRHRALGSLDQYFTTWALQGANDFLEPGDDYIYGAYDMGAVMVHGDDVEADGSDLAGYADVDFSHFYCNPEPGCRLAFVVNPMNWDTDVSFAIYKDMGLVREVDSEQAGYSESWDIPAESGQYHIAVATPDYMPGGSYNVVVQLYWPVSLVEQPVALQPDPPILQVLSLSGGILTEGTPSDGTLSLYDASGRTIQAWPVPARKRFITSTSGLRLASGVYFVGVTAKNTRSTAKLVVVR